MYEEQNNIPQYSIVRLLSNGRISLMFRYYCYYLKSLKMWQQNFFSLLLLEYPNTLIRAT